AAIRNLGLPLETCGEESALLDRVAHELAQGRVVGWFQGRMEFGPRALGARSILGDARHPGLQATMNLKIKFRESFRPFAPIVLRERAPQIFELSERHESPYMLLVAPVREALRRKLSVEDARRMESDPDLRHRVNVVRSEYPAITHVDYSARLQTVDEPRHGRLYRLMRVFEALTGSPVLVNTSFNVRGEPIVCTPADACRCFLATEMDVLAIENHLLFKDRMPARAIAAAKEGHLDRFQPD
ncbi:MAG: hypothetical protein L6Q38_18490, partial [Nitrospira sp.]|nr:hypothetical protein [Nitrospira sp.]